MQRGHRDRVYHLADRLGADGIDVELGQYYESDPPADGWATWSERLIETADFVLMICTEFYLQRYRKEAPAGQGQGVAWEGMVITQAIYSDYGRNKRFIPLIMAPADRQYIPISLTGTSFYLLVGEKGYERLYRRLTRQPERIKRPVGTYRLVRPKSSAWAGRRQMAAPIQNLPQANRQFIGREEILQELQTQLQSGGRSVLTQVLHGLGGISSSPHGTPSGGMWQSL